jgi:hypothetical protein
MSERLLCGAMACQSLPLWNVQLRRSGLVPLGMTPSMGLVLTLDQGSVSLAGLTAHLSEVGAAAELKPEH